MNSLKAVLALLAWLLAADGSSFGQIGTAEVVGRVEDPSGAVIVDARDSCGSHQTCGASRPSAFQQMEQPLTSLQRDVKIHW